MVRACSSNHTWMVNNLSHTHTHTRNTEYKEVDTRGRKLDIYKNNTVILFVLFRCYRSCYPPLSLVNYSVLLRCLDLYWRWPVD